MSGREMRPWLTIKLESTHVPTPVDYEKWRHAMLVSLEMYRTTMQAVIEAQFPGKSDAFEIEWTVPPEQL